MKNEQATLESEELIFWLRLLLTSGIGPQRARKLLATFGSAQAIFEQSVTALSQIVPSKQASALIHEPQDFDVACQRLKEWLSASPNHHALTLGDLQYPQSLYQISDPPLMLFANGKLDLLQNTALAIVGSRNPTAQGKETTTDFARTLSRTGITIVSGMASGVDGCAQSAALEGEGKTIAVLGTGIDRVYPASHRNLAHQIAQQGLLLSEFPLGTPPVSTNFPKRNRIIAGLASGTLVVEATLHSGSLITAKLAAEMGKEVFAIPGSIHSPQSKGCHWLIRQGAKLVESAQDILEEFHWSTNSLTQPSQTDLIQKPASQTEPQTNTQVNMEVDEEHQILDAIGEGPTSLEAIIARTELDTATLQTQLLNLELDQKIARLPGNLFQRLHIS